MTVLITPMTIAKSLLTCTTSALSTALRPLISCTQLRYLHLYFPSVDLLDDDWLANEVAMAWPLMETLHLSQHWVGTLLPKMTASGLSTLIRTHPLLSDIQFPLDIMM